MQMDWALGLIVVVSALLAALAGLLAISALQSRASTSMGGIFAETTNETCFLFDGESLVDATPGARALLSVSPAQGGPWPRLMAYLAPRFPGLEAQFARLSSEGRLAVSSSGDAKNGLLVRAEYRGGLTYIALQDQDDQRYRSGQDAVTQKAIQDELGQLRATVAQSPLLIWRENTEGDVTWANAAYLALATQRLGSGQDLSWPLPRLFEKSATPGAKHHRQRVELTGQADRWFNLQMAEETDLRLMFAQPIDAVVQAESTLRDFMQTLTKTFAHLPIGLAIFDRQRQLALFNPALLDLSGLQPDFLSLRPTLFSFLDAMRDRNMIPEPKDYRAWRKQMAALEQAASSGLFEETWSLPSGQTYHVIGRPHPNGALALMFEDISTEMSRIRRYRADLELGQAVIDAVQPALAVFSSGGILVMSNTAYSELWGHDPAATLADGSISALCNHWRSQSAPTPFWEEAEDFVATMGQRDAINGEVRLTDGRLLTCHIAALPGGSSLATFRLPLQAEAQATPNFTSSRNSRSA